MMPPGPRTTSQEMAAVVPTVPAAPAPMVTSAEELARREEAAERKALRSRIAEAVALAVVVLSALAQIARAVADAVGGHQ